MESFYQSLGGLFEQGSYVIVFVVLVLCGIGLPVPEEITFILAGVVVRNLYGDHPDVYMHLWIMVAVGVAGILAGDTCIYCLGRFLGARLMRRWPFRLFLSDARIQKSRQVFDQHGSKAIFVAGFLAGVRAATYFLAGTMGVPYLRFMFWDLMRALLTCPVSIWAGYFFGSLGDAEEHLKGYRPYMWVVVGLVVVGFGIHWYCVHRKSKEEAAQSPSASGEKKVPGAGPQTTPDPGKAP